MSERGILSRLAEARRLPIYVVLAGLLLSLPALGVGLYTDDYAHRAMAQDLVPELRRGPTELYEFFPPDSQELTRMRDLGILPWWTGDDLVLRFFRPAPSALLVLEERAFKDAIWPARLHTFFWFAALLLIATGLLRRFLSPRAATAAAFVYALSIIHTTPVTWMAARYALMVAVLGLASLWLHIRAREQPWKPGAFLAPLLLVAAYLCGESALGAAGMILFYEWVSGPGSLRRRVLAIAPAAIITLVYVGCHKAAGYGAQGSGVYVDPIGDSLGFLSVASWRVPALFGNMLAAAPSEIAFTTSSARAVLAAIGLVATVALFAGAWRLRSRMNTEERRALVWMLLAAGAAVVVAAGGVPGGRALSIPMLGGAALIGTVLAHAWPAISELRRGSAARIGLRAAVLALIVIHFAIGPLMRVGLTFALAEQSEEPARIARSMGEPCAQEMYLLSSSDPTVFLYAPLAALLQGKEMPRTLQILSMAPQDHRIENVRETGFDLVVLGPRRIGTWERIYRNTDLRAGEQVDLTGLSIRVEEVHNGWPARLRLDFRRPLSSPDFCFVHYRDGKILELPRPRIGETMLLRRELGPSQM